MRALSAIALIALFQCLTHLDYGIADEEAISRARVVARDARQLARDGRRISVYTANRFHAALVSRMLFGMPKHLELSTQYQGLIGFESGKPRFGQHGHFVGQPLSWMILDKAGLGIFTLSVSRDARRDTVAVCKIDDEVLYVSVSISTGFELPNSKKLREPCQELGGKSVLDVVQMLEGPESGLESQ